MPLLATLRLAMMSPRKRKKLTAEQRRMYASEKQMNFRTIAKLCATKSRYVLTARDLAPRPLQDELAQLGQFAEVAYAVLPPEHVFAHLDTLSRAGFPLEGYDALPGCTLVAAFRGAVADLPGFVAYRAPTRQLVVAFSGTATLRHALLDVHFRKKRHPAGRGCAVHAGFWKLYRGVKGAALEGLERGLREHDVQEVVLTGHSMGGAMAYLLALDLLVSEDTKILGDVPLTVVAFGAPRVGNAVLAQVWREAVKSRREKRGEHAVREHLIKAFNDGVPALPPASFGYRHFTEEPLYFCHGVLFCVPASEIEHGIFDVSPEAMDANMSPEHPRGGHNYYNSRDLEKLSRRMGWIQEMMGGGTEWEDQYLARVAKAERRRQDKDS